MNTSSCFFERVQDVCREIGQAASLESLYENLVHFIARACGSPASALMTVATYGAASNSFRVAQGTGRFSDTAGQTLRDEQVQELLRDITGRRSSHYGRNAVGFYLPCIENFAVLVYIELQQELDAEKRGLLSFINDKAASTIQVHALTRRADRTGRAMVVALANLAEHKDQDTGEHVLRVAIMTDEIVQVLNELGHYKNLITREFGHFISTASILHDVGKVSIPESILQKPGKLDPQERKIIEEHTLKGKQALEKASRILDGGDYLLRLSGEIALCHHEHYNGQGYPSRIASDEIPLSARIVGLVDVFDALASARPYKKAWPEKEVIDYIVSQSGRQFDPLIVEAFLKVMDCRREASLIRWTSTMSVKEPCMDDDHRVLIALINQLATAEKIGNRRNIEFVLDELVDYAIDHFSREERYLQDAGYPFENLVAHKLQHAAFTETIQDIRWQYQHGFCRRIDREVLLFLRDWLGKHILVEDMKYASSLGSA
ncbi:bacteriohemerythrin [Candidatus Ferrigenium straubiae]|jgi:hemerythrin-like metal-binding protein|uniref:bacteriohemerythrin n=1 Tax=Candidatus Ferrigenium straubiae TaxID=2919506 RepID=UPI003F4AA7AB